MQLRLLTLIVTVGALWPMAAGAQAPSPATPAPAAQGPPAAPRFTVDPDRAFNALQPDFTVIHLPTTLRMPLHKSSFRLTHRFHRSLGEGDFGNLVSDMFGLDNGAEVGLDARFGLARGLYVGVARTSDKTIEFLGEKNIVQQNDTHPIGLDLRVAIDGTDNFGDEFSPGLALVLSREVRNVGAFYIQPMWVGNVNIFEPVITADDNTIVLGLGTRLRVRPTVYIVAEFTPRLTGYDAGVHGASFGLEKRAGWHAFQLNVSDSFGTTMSQVARGGSGSKDWYLGFNLSRKFF